MDVAVLPRLHCFHCGYDWFPRAAKLPKACPDCQSRNWNLDKEHHRRKEDKQSGHQAG